MRNLWSRAYRCCQRYHIRLNVILFVILVVAVLLNVKYSDVAKHLTLDTLLSRHLDLITRVITVLRDIIYISALLVAAGWTYYTFIKGRTFVPKLNIDIELKKQRKNPWAFVILRVRIENIGKSKVKIGSEKMSVEYGYVQNSRLTYFLANEGINILGEHLRGNEYVFMEPSHISTLDLCLPLSSLIRNTALPEIPDVLRIKMELVCDGRVFQEIAIFDVGAIDGGK